MLILISPAKKLNVNPIYEINSIYSNTLPKFLENANLLIQTLKLYSIEKLKELLNISQDLASLNYARFQNWDINHHTMEVKKSLFLFNGDVYEGIDSLTLDDKELNYCQNYLRILSGLYGILAPFDAIYPYRLEMSTKFKQEKFKNLYDFWQETQTNYINEYFKVNKQDNILINLASDEYFKVINTKNLTAKIIKVVFEQQKNGIFKNISFLTKYARGLMVRYMAQNNIQSITQLKKFNLNGYKFEENLSDEYKLVFRLHQIR